MFLQEHSLKLVTARASLLGPGEIATLGNR
jgi:hypothetical protein